MTDIIIPQKTIQIAGGYESLGGGRDDGRFYPYHGGADRPRVWTIGRGHVCTAAQLQAWNKTGLSLDEVNKLFAADLQVRANHLDKLLLGKYTSDQFAAALSLFYNLEISAAYGHSFGDAHRAGKTKDAAKAMLLYINSNGQHQLGLWRRRMTEALCYLTGLVIVAKTPQAEAALEARLRKEIDFVRPRF